MDYTSDSLNVLKFNSMKYVTLSLVFLTTLFVSGCRQNFEKLYDKAQQAYEQKNYTLVIYHLNLAIPRWKSSDGTEKKAQAYQMLGIAHHTLKDIDQAAEAFREAIKLSDKTYDSAYGLGIIYLITKQYKPARDTFQIALRMKKDDPMALLGLGDSLYLSKQFEEAKAVYKRILEVSPGVREALDNIERINQKMPQLKHEVKKSSALTKTKPTSKKR